MEKTLIEADDGGLAFPGSREERVVLANGVDGRNFKAYPGLSMRDYFAAQALPSVIRLYPQSGRYCAERAYEIADEMLQRRAEWVEERLQPDDPMFPDVGKV